MEQLRNPVNRMVGGVLLFFGLLDILDIRWEYWKYQMKPP